MTRRMDLAGLGYGAETERFHFPALKRGTEFEVKHLMDIDPTPVKYLNHPCKMIADMVRGHDVPLTGNAVDAAILFFGDFQ